MNLCKEQSRIDTKGAPIRRLAAQAAWRTRRPTRSGIAATLSAAILGAGCHSSAAPKPAANPANAQPIPMDRGLFAPQTVRGQPALQNPTTMQWKQTQPLQPPVVDLPVEQGSLPLALIITVAGTARVSDLTEKQTLVETPVLPRQIVAVTEKGVTIGNVLLIPGPLPSDHEFGIFFYAAAGPGGYRSGTLRPG
jgi:hypothetical protein